MGIASTPNPYSQGFGTQQAHKIAKQLKGEFRRFANSPQGTVCELLWSEEKQSWWRF
ncbi:MAG: hypothetical protein HC836_44105 [Richelia sp. RM2_1_2]|nr:hypothetical protein [Richelia sp. RM2_1_2]